MKTNLIALTVTGVLFASCDKDDVPAPVTVQTKTVNNLQADTILGISAAVSLMVLVNTLCIVLKQIRDRQF